MTDERELARWRTAWVRGATNTKLGTAILTTERPLFFDEKFSNNATAGVLVNAIVDKLQQRHEDGGPLLDVPLAAVVGVTREKKLLNKDRIALATPDDVFLLNEGWKEWSGVLRGALTGELGRTVVEESPDVWRVEPA